MPLDDGYTVVEQLSSAAYPMKAERYEVLSGERSDSFETSLFLCSPAEPGMGIAPGGRMEQDIHDDPYGLDAWDQSHASRCVVSIVNTAQRLAKTGERPPTGPLPNANCPGSTTMAATARRSQGPRN